MGLAFSSGMAAETAIALSFLKSGDRLLSSNVIYGGTYGLFSSLLPGLGIEASFVNTTNLEEVKSVLKYNPKIVFLESPANPTIDVCDIQEICRMANEAGAICVVDNTFATPCFQRPLELGADLVVESCTKYIGGHSDLLGGAVVGSKYLIEKISEVATLVGGYHGHSRGLAMYSRFKDSASPYGKDMQKTPCQWLNSWSRIPKWIG